METTEQLLDYSCVRELSKAQRAYNNLSERYELLHRFVRGIVGDWECNPHHAAALLAEVERIRLELKVTLG